MLLCSHLHSSVLCRLGLHRCRSYVPNLPLSSYYATTPHTSFNTLRGTTPTLVPRKKVYTVEETLHYLHAQLLSANPPAPFSMYVAMRGEVVADRVAFLISSAMMNFNQWFIKLLQRAESNIQADEILSLAQENGYGDQAAIYNTKMSFHFLKKDFRLLSETRDLMRRNQVTPDYTTHCLCIKAYCSDDQIRKALECLAELEQSTAAGTLTIDANAYLPFMEYYVARKKAVGVYQTMKQRDVKPSQDIYAMLLHAAIPGGLLSLDSVVTQMQQVDKAPLEDIALRMNELAAAESMVHRGFEECKLLPRIRTLTRLVSVYSKQRTLDMISSLLQKMMQIEYVPDATFCQFIVGCFRKKECHPQIVQIHGYIRAKSIPITQECYMNLIKHYAAAGTPQLMTTTHKEMKGIFPVTAPVYSALMKGYALSDMIDDAEAVREQCLTEKLQLSFPSYVALIEAFYRRHDASRAKAVLVEVASVYSHSKRELVAELWKTYNNIYTLK